MSADGDRVSEFSAQLSEAQAGWAKIAARAEASLAASKAMCDDLYQRLLKAEAAAGWDAVADRANWIKASSFASQGAREPTGMLKQCPRCGRLGRVFSDIEGAQFEIIWEGHPRGPLHDDKAPGAPDRDACVSGRDLLNPEFGCGYDYR